MPQFQHGRASIHYEIAGDGPPLLLIAGIASDGASWGPLLPLLPGRRLIRIDNRGCGQTKVEGPIEIEQMVDDCAALLDHLGLGAVDFVGHSLGGFIALWLAAKHPGRVRRLVTMTAGAIPASKRVLFHDMARLYFTMAPEDWYGLLYQWLFSEPFFEDEAVVRAAAEASTLYPNRQSPGDFARQVAAIDRLPAIDVSPIGCPVLALTAELDLLAPAAGVIEMHSPIANVRHQTIARAAHSVHWERPQETADAIVRFLS
jgi:pimeloyl-ACP methyl ester carboxylesterase